jgi:hypothetical protein
MQALKLPERFSEDAITRYLKSFASLFLLGLLLFAWNAPHVRVSFASWFWITKVVLAVGIPAVAAATSHLLFSRNVFRGLLVNLGVSAGIVGAMWLAIYISKGVHGWLAFFAVIGGVYLSINQIVGALLATALYVANPRERTIGWLALAAALVVARRMVF